MGRRLRGTEWPTYPCSLSLGDHPESPLLLQVCTQPSPKELPSRRQAGCRVREAGLGNRACCAMLHNFEALQGLLTLWENPLFTAELICNSALSTVPSSQSTQHPSTPALTHHLSMKSLDLVLKVELPMTHILAHTSLMSPHSFVHTNMH